METPPRELMAFKATEEPRLMHARRELMMRETRTALRGTFQFGETWVGGC